MRRDVEHLQSRMSKIEGSGELSQHLLNIVNDKSIPLDKEEKKMSTEFSPPADKKTGEKKDEDEDEGNEKK